MPDRCCIPECRAISNRINGKISMFRLPRDMALRSRWLKSMGKKDWTPADKAVICERHFEPSCITKKVGDDGPFDKNGRRWKSRIALGSLPTILVPPGTPTEPVQVRVRKKRRGRNKKLMETRRKRGRRRLEEKDLDSMPLQKRLTAIASAGSSQEPEPQIPTLKSQPLSPTKLKVTRQSASKSQQQLEQPKPAEEVKKPIREEVCLKWNTHHSNLQTMLPALLNREQYCDVTLVAEGRSLKCHKLILSSCSSYFDDVLEKVTPFQHPIIFMKDISFDILKSLCEFMYVGEVNILNRDLDQILRVGESLKIKGLACRSDIKDNNTETITGDSQKQSAKSTRSSLKPSTLEKNDNEIDVDVTDPLDLLEPTYEEAATPDLLPPVLKRNELTRKSTGKRIRKRKHVEDEREHEPSPPVFRMRKGTRSRPNVKVPRYFNANFDNSAPATTPEPPEYTHVNDVQESIIDPYVNILEQIKTEPLDIEDDMMSYGEEMYSHETSHLEPEVEQYDTMPEIEETVPVVKKRRLSKKSVPAKVETPDISTKSDNIGRRRRTRKTVADSREENENQEDNDYSDRLTEHRYEEVNPSDPEAQNIDAQIENSDIIDAQIENSDIIDAQIVNSDIIDAQLENNDTIEAQIEDSDAQIEKNDVIDAQIENDTNEAQIKDSEEQIENSDTTDAQMEKSDIIVAQKENNDRSDGQIKNNEINETSARSNDIEGKIVGNSHDLSVTNEVLLDNDNDDQPKQHEDNGEFQNDQGSNIKIIENQQETNVSENIVEESDRNVIHAENCEPDNILDMNKKTAEMPVLNMTVEEPNVEKSEKEDIQMQHTNIYQEIRIESTYTDEAHAEISEDTVQKTSEDGVELKNSDNGQKSDIHTEEVNKVMRDNSEKSENIECHSVSNRVDDESSKEKCISDKEETQESYIDQNALIPTESTSDQIPIDSTTLDGRNDTKDTATTGSDPLKIGIE